MKRGGAAFRRTPEPTRGEGLGTPSPVRQTGGGRVQQRQCSQTEESHCERWHGPICHRERQTLASSWGGGLTNSTAWEKEEVGGPPQWASLSQPTRRRGKGSQRRRDRQDRPGVGDSATAHPPPTHPHTLDTLKPCRAVADTSRLASPPALS